MARLYADENFPLPAVEALRGFGHDVLTTGEAGKANQALSDKAVLQFAISEQRAVLTMNRKHSVRLHQDHPHHWGVIVCTSDVDFSALATRIDAALRSTALAGSLVRINRPAS